MSAEENTDRSTTDLGPARRRKAMRVERGSTQALLIAAIPLLVLLLIVILGAWVLGAQDRKQQAAVSTPTHLPTLRPATLVAVGQATATATIAAEAVPTEAEPEPTATEEPTATATAEVIPTEAAPEATATPEVDPNALVAGVTAEVSGTGAQGLRIRAAAGLSAASLKVVPEGTVLTILGGPESVDDYDWYQVRDEYGVEGWVAGDWLVRSK